MGTEKQNGKWQGQLLQAILLGGVVLFGYFGAALWSAHPLFVEPTEAVDKPGLSAAVSTVSSDDFEPLVTSSAYHILNKTIREELKLGRPSYALKLLGSDPMAQKIKNAEYDKLRASIAQSYLIEGKTQKAFDVARASSRRSRHDAPEAAWVGGLAAWKMDNYQEAADFFSVAAKSNRASVWLKSGSAFWAARAYGRMGNMQEATNFMEIAARYPRTFYGLIALRSLDRDFNFNWDKPDLKHKHKKSLEASGKVQQAIELSQKGEITDALTSLGKSGWLDNGVKQRQLLAYILDQDVPALSLHLGRMTKDANGDFYDIALYPEAPWNPDKGYEVDSALVNALIRQESRFNPQAKNASGASGLMQLMPSTASYMAKGIDVSLTHPQTNISVGQKYVRHLLMDSNINNDLFYMAVAYNAGPGNLARWKRQYKDIDDPLLFIESIPSSETRAFVERVMVNYWIYRIREGKDNPSLDAVAFERDEEYTDAGTRHNSLEFASN